MDHRVQTIIALIDEDDMRTIPSVNELAHLVHLSSSRLNHVFRVETGKSLAHYVKALRMRRARELLESTFLNVKEIMAIVGFTDVSHFVKDFRRTFGLTPAEYKQHHLNSKLIVDEFRLTRAQRSHE